MPRKFFSYPETRALFELLERVSQASSMSRGQAFEDFLHLGVGSLADGATEEQYLATVAKHTMGPMGKRRIDLTAELFQKTIAAMAQARGEMKDVLGDLFEGAIADGENGRCLTPMPLCRAMARLAVGETDANESTEPRTAFDPCCGSGRMLLAVAEINRRWEFVGQDIDLRCVRMTALNLAIRNLCGYVILREIASGRAAAHLPHRHQRARTHPRNSVR